MQPKMNLIEDFSKLKPLFYNLIITGIIIFVLSNPITSYLYLNNMDKDSTFHAEQNQIYRGFENIKEDENYKIIFLGSSMTREGIDCIVIENHYDSLSCYNLGSSSDIPYLRLLEISKIIEAKPDLVVIEITPNTFANISNLDYLDPIIELRIGLASTIQNEEEQRYWRGNIRDEDEKYLVENSIEKTLFWNKYRQDILNEGIKNGLSSDAKNVDMKSPTRNYSVKTDEELLQLMDSFYDEKGGFFSENINQSLNLVSMEIMLNALILNGIDIVFQSQPLNLLAINNAPENFWDNYNFSVNKLEKTYNLTHYNHFYSKNYNFVDLTHLDYEGRQNYSSKFAEFLNETGHL